MVPHRFFTLPASLACFLFCASAASAGTLTWSPNGVDSAGGNGTWNSTSLDWYPGSGSVDLPWANGSTAVFGGSAGTVTLGADGLITGGLQFNTSGYTINGDGNTLNLVGAFAFISGLNTTINAALASSIPVSVTGSLTLNNGGNLGPLNVTSGSTILNGGTLVLNDANAPFSVGTASTSGQLTIQNGSILNALGNTSLVDGKVGTGLTVSGAGSQLNTGNQLLVGNNTSGSLTIQNGAAMTNSGSLFLGVNSGAAGTLFINGGTVTTGAGVLGESAGSSANATVTGAASAWNVGSLAIGANQTSGGAATLNITNNGAVTVSGSTELYPTGSITVTQGKFTTGLLSSNAAGSGSISIADPGSGSALTINGASGSATYFGTITGTGSLVKNGASVQTLNNAGDTFSGTTTINGGSLVLGTGSELRNSTVLINVDNGLNLNGVASATLGGLAGAGALNFGATSLTVGANNSTTTYSGVLTGTGSFNTTGSGTLNLTGGGSVGSLNASTGGGITVDGANTVLNAGSAAIAAAFGPGTIAIQNGGSLITGSAGVGLKGMGLVSVNGPGSVWNTGSLDLYSASGGLATIEVTSGGAVNVAGTMAFVGGDQQTSGQLTIQLSNGSTFSTGMIIEAGMSDSNIILSDAASTLTVNGASGTSLFAGTISGAGNLAKSGGSSLELVNSQDSFSGTTTINGGALILGTGLELQNSTVVVNVDNGLNLNGVASATLGGLAGMGALNFGSTSLTVGANNSTTTYSGALTGTGSFTTTGSGTLTLAGGGSIGSLNASNGGLVVGGGTLTVNNALTQQTGTLTINNGATLLTAGVTVSNDGAITVDGTNTVLNAGSAAIAASGPGTITIQNGGSLVTGSATFGVSGTGMVFVNGSGSAWNTGSLEFSDAGSETIQVSSGGAVNVAGTTGLIGLQESSGNVSILLSGGSTFTTGLLSGAAMVNSNILLSDAASTFTVNGASGNSVFAGTIGGAGNLTKSGGSTLELINSQDNFSGTTTINGGALILGTGRELQNSTVFINVDNGLNLNGAGSATLGTLAGTGALNLGNTVLVAGGNNATTTYSGTLSGAGSLSKTGSGTLTLTGGGSAGELSIMSGGLTIGGGVLNLTSTTSPLTISGGTLTINNGGQLIMNGTAGAIDSAILVSGNGSTLQASTIQINGSSSAASLTVQNGASVTAGQSLEIGVTGNASLNVQNGGSLVSNSTILGLIAGASGTASVTGANSTWTAADLHLGSFGQSAGGTGTLTVANGGAVNVTGTTEFFTAPSSIVVNGGTFSTGALISYAPGIGSINLTSDPAGGAALNITGSGSGTYSGMITGAGSLTKSGSGTQTLTGANSFTGPITVNGGILQQLGGTSFSSVTVGNGGTYQTGGGASIVPSYAVGTLTAQTGGTIIYGAGSTIYGGFLAGPGTHDAAGATFNGTTITPGATVTFTGATTFNNVTDNGAVVTSAPLLTWTSGQIGGSGTLNVNSLLDVSGLNSYGLTQVANGGTLSSAGNLSLDGGSRTYVGSVASPGGEIDLTGGTLELNGGLLVNNGTIDGTVDVNFGGLAEGAGTYGAVNVNQGGTFHAGNSPGEVTSQSANWNAGGAFQFDIINADGMPGDDWGLWTITGELNIAAGSSPNSQFTIDIETLIAAGAPGLLANFNPTQDYQWVFATAEDISGFAASDFAINAADFGNQTDGGRFYLSSNGQQLALDFQAASTPEPATWTLLLCALALAGLWRGRFRCGNSR